MSDETGVRARFLPPGPLVVVLLIALLGAATVITVAFLNKPVEPVGWTDPLPEPEVAVPASPHPAVETPPADGPPRPGAAISARAAVEPALTDPAVGPVAVSVVDVATDDALLQVDPDRPVTPASTTKLLTAASALTVLPRGARLATTVLVGSAPGEIVLVGGGDPTLRRTEAAGTYPGAGTVADLAQQVRDSGVGPVERIVVDSTRYSGPLLAPGVPQTWIAGGSIAAMRPVMVDGGRQNFDDDSPRVTEPDLVAGRALADALGNPDAEVVRGGATPGARRLAEVESPPMEDLVAFMVVSSDNVLAEALGRWVAAEMGLPASYQGAAQAVRRGATLVGVSSAGIQLQDASGLSPLNTITPRTLTSLMTRAALDSVVLDPLVATLPVAGFSGTLADRYRDDAAARAGAGMVRAKTGRLPGVAALAGLVQSADGRLLAFAFMAGDVPSDPLKASEMLDRAAAGLARCACGG